jgi:hypothetical protein
MMENCRTRSAVAGTVLLGGLAVLIPLEPSGAKVEDYVIEAEFIPEQSRMSATVDISFVPGSVKEDTLVFFLHGELGVEYVEIGGQRVEALQELVFHENDYSNVANRVNVPLENVESTGGMRVGYSGYFHPSVVGAMSNYMRIDRDGVFLRSLGYSIWFPVFVETWRDSYDVSFSKVTIRTPADFRAVFAGEHVQEHEEGGARISVWSAEHLDLFDAQCTARRFGVMSDGGFHLYHLRDSVSQRKASEILSFSRRLESLYRTFYRHAASADQIHVIQMPEYGDIASGNAIGISDDVWTEFEVTSWRSTTVAHELVHSFVRLPHSDEMGSLVIEGFPSYFHLPAMAEILGEDWYRDYLKRIEDQYVSKRETGRGQRGERLPPEKPILEIGTDEISEYKDTFVLNDRVRLFFDYLRRRLGAGGFFELTSDLLNRNMLDYETVVAVIGAHLPGSGRDMYRWLRTSEYPDEFRLGAH